MPRTSFARNATLAMTLAATFTVIAPAQAAVLMGQVQDRESKKAIAGATVSVVGLSRQAKTDREGRFMLEGVPEGKARVKVEAPGYLPYLTPAVPFADARPTDLTLALRPGRVEVKSQVVSGSRPSRLAQAETSKRSFTAEEVKKTAGARNDPILAVTNTAGVATGGFSGAPVVRGGGPNDNLYYLDNVQIGNPFHFGGLVSVFNANTISRVDLYTGALPARYGNVMSAVIDVETRPPKSDALHGVFDANLLYSEGLLEGPLTPFAALSLAGRRSYIDLIAGRVFPAFTVFPRFSDYQGKLTSTLPGGGRLDLSAIGSQDALGMTLEDGTTGRGFGSISMDSGYRSSGAVWSQPLGDALSQRLTLNYQEPYTDLAIGRFLTIRDFRYQWTLADDLAWQVHDRHQLRMGLRYDTINFVSRRIQPDTSSLRDRPRTTPPTPEEIEALPKLSSDTSGNEKILGVYLEDAWKLTDSLTASLGARYDRLQSTAEDHLAPRLGLSWRMDSDTTWRLGYGQQVQFPDPSRMLPGIGNPGLRAAYSLDAVAGVDRQITERLLGKFEIYHRDLVGLSVADPDQRYANLGSGRAFGAEATLELARWNGWTGSLALTAARAFRTTPKDGEIRYDYDQPFIGNLSLVGPTWVDWSPSLRLRVSSGRPYTPVVDRRQLPDGTFEPVNGPTNSARYPNGLTWSARAERPAGILGATGSFYVEVTQQREVFGVDYGENYERISDPIYNYGLPIIPYLGYQLSF
ncbi:TonB-dependent Receptor Plug Domain protein [compost metagenome]